MFKKIIIYILIFLSLVLNFYLLFKPKKVEIKYIKNNYPVDTIYNKIVKDSIIYNIIVKDNVINNIKNEMNNEIEEVINYNDSCAVELFNKLSSE